MIEKTQSHNDNFWMSIKKKWSYLEQKQ